MNATYFFRCSLVFCLLILNCGVAHAGLEHLETPIYVSQSSTSGGAGAIYAVDPATEATTSQTRKEHSPWLLLDLGAVHQFRGLSITYPADCHGCEDYRIKVSQWPIAAHMLDTSEKKERHSEITLAPGPIPDTYVMDDTSVMHARYFLIEGNAESALQVTDISFQELTASEPQHARIVLASEPSLATLDNYSFEILQTSENAPELAQEIHRLSESSDRVLELTQSIEDANNTLQSTDKRLKSIQSNLNRLTKIKQLEKPLKPALTSINSSIDKVRAFASKLKKISTALNTPREAVKKLNSASTGAEPVTLQFASASALYNDGVQNAYYCSVYDPESDNPIEPATFNAYVPMSTLHQLNDTISSGENYSTEIDNEALDSHITLTINELDDFHDQLKYYADAIKALQAPFQEINNGLGNISRITDLLNQVITYRISFDYWVPKVRWVSTWWGGYPSVKFVKRSIGFSIEDILDGLNNAPFVNKFIDSAWGYVERPINDLTSQFSDLIPLPNGLDVAVPEIPSMNLNGIIDAIEQLKQNIINITSNIELFEPFSWCNDYLARRAPPSFLYDIDSDHDGLPNYQEAIPCGDREYFSLPACPESAPDYSGTNFQNPDTDGDGLKDGFEFYYATEYPSYSAFDPNSETYAQEAELGLIADADFDSDGATNLQEQDNGTDPYNRDSDDDGMPDGIEILWRLNPLDPADAGQDNDGDGLSNLHEATISLALGVADLFSHENRYALDPQGRKTDAHYLITSDRDGDRVSDWRELQNGTNPLEAADADSNGIPDDWESYYFPDGIPDDDPDNDTYSNIAEWNNQTDPLVPNQGPVEAADIAGYHLGVSYLANPENTAPDYRYYDLAITGGTEISSGDAIELPFPLFFYGQFYERITPLNNAVAVLSDLEFPLDDFFAGSSGLPDNEDALKNHAFLSPFAARYIDNSKTSISYQAFAENAHPLWNDESFVIQYEVYLNEDLGVTETALTFQIILLNEGQRILFAYDQTETPNDSDAQGALANIGIQGKNAQGMSYSYMESSLADNMVMTFSPRTYLTCAATTNRVIDGIPTTVTQDCFAANRLEPLENETIDYRFEMIGASEDQAELGLIGSEINTDIVLPEWLSVAEITDPSSPIEQYAIRLTTGDIDAEAWDISLTVGAYAVTLPIHFGIDPALLPPDTDQDGIIDSIEYEPDAEHPAVHPAPQYAANMASNIQLTEVDGLALYMEAGIFNDTQYAFRRVWAHKPPASHPVVKAFNDYGYAVSEVSFSLSLQHPSASPYIPEWPVPVVFHLADNTSENYYDLNLKARYFLRTVAGDYVEVTEPGQQVPTTALCLSDKAPAETDSRYDAHDECSAPSELSQFDLDRTTNGVFNGRLLVIYDNIAPVLTIPDDIVLLADDFLTEVNFGEPSALDALDENITFSMRIKRIEPLFFNEAPENHLEAGTYTVTWTATDKVKNSTEKTQQVTVLDPPPVFTSEPVTTLNDDFSYEYRITASDENVYQEADLFERFYAEIPDWLTLDSTMTTATLHGNGFAVPGEYLVNLELANDYYSDDPAIVYQSFTITILDDQDGDGVPYADDAFPMDKTEWSDHDGDGIGNNADPDDDNDGTDDVFDDLPFDASDTSDTDGDGIGDLTDTDIDNDGVANDSDFDAYNADEQYDSDGDGIGDNADVDDDNDGFVDRAEFLPPPDAEGYDVLAQLIDAFPLDPNEHLDTDGDGIGNNADDDDDADGVTDENDAFPLDPTEHADLDGDGIGDNTDPDIDGDGIPNDQDPAPLDPLNAGLDSDEDGVFDKDDAFPLDPEEQLDTDLDGIGNNADDDDDGDGIPDEDDALPLDTDNDGINNDEDDDIDGDGVLDRPTGDLFMHGLPTLDASGQLVLGDDYTGISLFMKDGEEQPLDVFPFDPTEQFDSDGDGIGNNADTDDDNDGVPDVNDVFPYDGSRWADLDGDGIADNYDTDIDGDGLEDHIIDQLPYHLAAWEDSDYDGMPESWADGCDASCQQASGLVLDAYPNDTDNDGVSNEFDTDNNRDDGLPSIDAVGGTLTLVANNEGYTGYHFDDSQLTTMVAELSMWDAVDSPAELTVIAWLNGQNLLRQNADGTPADDINDTPTGTHTLYWQVQDQAGNLSEQAAQEIRIYPRMMLSQVEITTGEASDVTFDVQLTGDSPSYPLAAELVFNADDSTVELSDFATGQALLDGVRVEINEEHILDGVPGIRYALSFAFDGTDEYPEQAIFALRPVDDKGAELHEAQSTLTIYVHDNNLAPELSLEIRQNGQIVDVIGTHDGDVTVTLQISDPNGLDYHEVTWQLGELSGGVTVAADSRSVTFNPESLAAGDYTVMLTATDNGIPALSAEIEATWTVNNTEPETTEQAPGQGSSSKSGGGHISWLFILGLLWIGWARRYPRGHCIRA